MAGTSRRRAPESPAVQTECRHRWRLANRESQAPTSYTALSGGASPIPLPPAPATPSPRPHCDCPKLARGVAVSKGSRSSCARTSAPAAWGQSSAMCIAPGWPVWLFPSRRGRNGGSMRARLNQPGGMRNRVSRRQRVRSGFRRSPPGPCKLQRAVCGPPACPRPGAGQSNSPEKRLRGRLRLGML